MRFRVGSKYKLVYRNPDTRQKHNRTAVMVYLGEKHEANKHVLVFSARPVAGTQEMPLSWISEIREASPEAPVYINKVVRKR